MTLKPAVNDTDHGAGPSNAPVTLVEYGDFQCPYCYRAHPIVSKLQEQFGARLRFIFRNFPLTQIHPNAQHAAEAAESVAARAGDEAYWRMHHSILRASAGLPGCARRRAPHSLPHQLPAPIPRWCDRTSRRGHSRAVCARISSSGLRSGVNGTPTFFINGVRFEGNWTSVKEFASALEAAAGVVPA